MEKFKRSNSKKTQSKTLELLQSMRIPDDIRNISLEGAEEGGEGV